MRDELKFLATDPRAAAMCFAIIIHTIFNAPYRSTGKSISPMRLIIRSFHLR